MWIYTMFFPFSWFCKPKSGDLKHFSHKHNLKQECDNIPFQCDGCKEPGLGGKFRCHECNYNLHLNCARANSTTSHSFYPNCEFTFLKAAPWKFTFLKAAPWNHLCNACGRRVKGFVFRCKAYDYYLHPLCANLPRTIKEKGIKLHLSESKSVKSDCDLCGNTESKVGLTGWSYVSTCKKYHFHVSCVKNPAAERTNNTFFEKIKMKSPDMSLIVTPNLQLTSQTGAISTGAKFSKYWKILAEVVLKLIISTVIGDPIGGLAALIESVLSG